MKAKPEVPMDVRLMNAAATALFAAGAVLLLAAGGVQDLYGAAAQKQLQLLLGSTDVNASVPRTSIRRLTGAKLQLMARVDHGAYRFEDPEFQSWVAARRTVD